jgi:hypothetical protein
MISAGTPPSTSRTWMQPFSSIEAADGLAAFINEFPPGIVPDSDLGDASPEEARMPPALVATSRQAIVNVSSRSRESCRGSPNAIVNIATLFLSDGAPIPAAARWRNGRDQVADYRSRRPFGLH